LEEKPDSQRENGLVLKIFPGVSKVQGYSEIEDEATFDIYYREIFADGSSSKWSIIGRELPHT